MHSSTPSGKLAEAFDEMTMPTTRPQLTVIAAAVDDYATIVEALRAVEDQTAFADIELLIVLDSLARFGAPADFARRHPRLRLVEVGRPLLLNEARAIGIALARADFIFILEDHCLPDRDCLARIVARVREKRWAVIGPAFVSGNRHSVWGRAANLLTYGEWMGYTQAEERPFVAGYSSAWQRSALQRLAPHLERDLAIPSRLQERLRQAGERIFFEPGAVMWHWESSREAQVRRILFRQGLGMGFVRQGTASLGGRARASLFFPALVGYRALRAARAWRRTRNGSRRVLLALPWLALVWSTGEVVGYWTRDARAALQGVSDVERQRQPFIDEAHEPLRRPWA
jgi:GT2 family glycosyltransferase